MVAISPFTPSEPDAKCPIIVPRTQAHLLSTGRVIIEAIENMGELADAAAECDNEKDMAALENHLQKLSLNEMMKNQKQQQPKERLSNLKRSVQQSRTIKTQPQDEYELEDSETEYY